MRRARWLLALGAGFLILLTTAPPAAAGTWALQSVPTRLGPNGQLLGITCPSATDCVAVGSFINPLGEQRALIEKWSGSGWSLQTAPSPGTLAYLRGVSCTSASACTAVGAYGPGFANKPLVERWNGVSWATETVTPPSGSVDTDLTAVSCTSGTACTAVGSYTTTTFSSNLPLAEQWNGTAWTQQTTPAAAGATESGLNGVDCISATSCYAVGDDTPSGEPSALLAEHWDGTNWTLQTITTPAGATAADLEGISCSAEGACTAVGGYATSGTFSNLTLAERWDGANWSQQTTTNPVSGSPSFNSVSCPTASECVAAGSPEDISSAPLIEQWNGTTWTTQAAPGVAGKQVSDVLAVSCTSASSCEGVGLTASSNVTQLTLAEGWNGISWSIQTTPNRSGAESTNLSGVSCTTAPSCAAVGTTTNSKGMQQTVADTWDGTSWTLRTTPNPSPTLAQLNSVSCASSTACTAVGTSNKTSHSVTLAERWDGSSWTLQSSPNRSSTSTNVLFGVSCASVTSCMAVGEYFNGTAGHLETLTEQWDGSSWTVRGSPNPAGVTLSMLSGVSCTSSTSCLAVGGYTTNGSFTANQPLAEVWDGTKWTIRLPKTPPGATLATLSGASCVSATSCMAVGGSATSPGAPFPTATLAEAWNGTAWTVKTTDPAFEGFSGDSCATASACTAVGQAYFAEDWNGTTWSTDTLATLPGGGNGSFSAVSCASSTTCTATGANHTNYVVEPIFANNTFVDQLSMPLAEEDPPSAAAPAVSPALGGQSVTTIRPGVTIATVG